MFDKLEKNRKQCTKRAEHKKTTRSLSKLE